MKDITAIHPRLQEKFAELVKLCKAQGIIITHDECVRTKAEQDAKYAQGRTKAGPIVTNVKYPNSQHCWGVAVDFKLNMDMDGDGDIDIKDMYNNNRATFNRVGQIAKSIGLGWGGDWKGLIDLPHLYLKDWGNTPAPLISKYGTPENFMKTWENEKDYTGIFDATFYCERYPDIKKAIGEDSAKLYEHYLNYGVKEGRMPSVLFDPKYYSSKYPDLQKAYGNDWAKYAEHYINKTINGDEWRAGSEVFDIRYYRDNHKDLKDVFGDNAKRYAEHFVTFGIYERRRASDAFSISKYMKHEDLERQYKQSNLMYIVHWYLYGKNENRITA